jgi:uncharacterized protein YjdB/fibronectin type 3 domain-containing protein
MPILKNLSMKKHLHNAFILALCLISIGIKARTIPHSGMTATATSEQNSTAEVALASYAIDDDPSTFWHTQWHPTQDALPQSITINLGATYNIDGLVYKPRQGNSNGQIGRYNIYVSLNGTDFSKVTSGTWVYDASDKTAGFAAVNARYVRLEALEGTINVATAAEINILEATGIPPAPTGLTAIPGNAQIELSWAASSGATSYSIYRGTTSNGQSETAIANGIAGTTYTNAGLTNGTQYYYKIKASNTNGMSGFSTEATATPQEPGVGNLALTKPTTVSSVEGGGTHVGSRAVDGNTTTRWASDFVDPSWIYVDLGTSQNISRVVLNWEPAYGKGYMIQTSTDATTWTSRYSTTTGNGGIDDINFATVSARYVRMYGFTRATGYGYSLWEYEVYANGSTTPSAPTDLAATGGNAQVTLNWTAVSGATSYTVYRGTSSGSETIVASGITETTYTNTGLVNGTQYFYRVSAEVTSGDAIATSAYSNEASATTIEVVPSAPTNLTAKPGNAQVVLDWTVSPGATSYNIYRGTTAGGESATPIATGVTANSYLDFDVTNKTQYFYKVKATNNAGTSNYSSEASATPTQVVKWYTIENAWFDQNNNGFLFDNKGINISYSPLPEENDSFRWSMEEVGGGYVRLKNQATGNYINIASGERNVKTSAIDVTDITSHWMVAHVEENTNLYIQNRSNSHFLNNEHLLGYVESDISTTPKGGNLWSAQWILHFEYETGLPPIPVTGVTIDPASATIEGYGALQLNAVIAPDSARNKKVTWTSSDTSVVAVSETGLVSATKLGSAVITVTTREGGFTATSSITVSAIPVSEISIIPGTLSVFKNKTRSLVALVSPSNATNKVFTWSSSNPEVAQVSIHGTVTGISQGTAIITATTKEGNKTATATITVLPAGNATPVKDFIGSIGVNTAISSRGEDLAHTVDALNYLGIGFIRYEGSDVNSVNSLHHQTGAKTVYLVGGAPEFSSVIERSSQMANAGSLLAIEGPNEPNTWRIQYQGHEGGGDMTWIPVMKYQRDLYTALKSDPILRNYPVLMFTDNGAEFDNAGAQFIKIPEGAGTLMPAGTQLADYATVHNYYSHPLMAVWLIILPGVRLPTL